MEEIDRSGGIKRQRTFLASTTFISKILLCIWCISFAALPPQVHGNPLSLKLFPFGPQHEDILLTKDVDDVSSPEVRLKTPIMFYGTQYTGIYVSFIISLS